MLLGYLKLATDCECPLSKIFLKIFLKQKNGLHNDGAYQKYLLKSHLLDYKCFLSKIFLKLPVYCECRLSNILTDYIREEVKIGDQKNPYTHNSIHS